MTSSLAQVESLFTTPALAAAGAAAVAVPIAIHLLSRARRKREVWGAMRWLVEAYRKQRRRARLEHLLLLLSRCLAVLLLGLALAGPRVTGALQGVFGDIAPSQREVVIVINHAITGAVRDAEGATRLDRHRAQASAVIDRLDPTDRVTVISAARPAAVRVDAGSPAEARAAIDALSVIAARPDLGGALSLAAERVDASPVAAARRTVLVLDDWAAAGRRDRRRLPQGLAGLGEQARVRVSRPEPSAANVQVAALVPRRSTLVADAVAGVLPATVTLRRYADALPRTARVSVSLGPPRGEAVSQTTREVRFGAGEAETEASIELALPSPTALTQRESWVLRASVLASGGDAVPIDDTARAWVSIRSRLRVLIVDDASNTPARGLSAARWVELALSPGDDRGGGVDTVGVAPLSLTADQLDTADAVMLLTPGGVSARAWPELAEAVAGGTVLWVWPEASVRLGSGSNGAWFDAMAAAFGLDWMRAAEPVAAAAEPWLAVETAAPAALSLLGADWSDLVRPLRVSRYWPIDAASDDAAWLTLNNDDPVLLARAHGRGAVLLSTVAIDASWTNLPTKPLFVPLLHEAMRGVIGGDPVAGRTPRGTTVVGDTADSTWQRLAADEGPDTVAVVEGEAFTLPGLYVATPPAGRSPGPAPRRLAVAVDADAADTAALDQAAITRWLEPIGPWAFAEADGAEATLGGAGPRVDLAWPLLWGLLAVVLLETAMARRFSHAQTGRSGRPMLTWLWRRVWHPQASASAGKRGAAA